MNRKGVIDVGTNSVKFRVGERAADGTWTTVVDRAEVTRAGDGIAATAAIHMRCAGSWRTKRWDMVTCAKVDSSRSGCRATSIY
jgi:hypothetical protein